MDNKKYILESLIFVSGKPIKIKKLSQISKTKEEEVKSYLEELDNEYEKGERGFRIIFKSDSAQIVSNPEYAGYVKSLVTEDLREDLSRVALETLSIIAYRGPITRSEMELIRGVNCIYILRNLLIRGLIEKTKSGKDARRSIYQVSFKLLRHLGIKSVKYLPQYEKLSKEVLLSQERPDE